MISRQTKGHIIAFDFGLKRIGVAVGQLALKSSEPLSIIHAKQGKPNWQDIEKIIATWSPIFFVVGWPLHLDGSKSKFCDKVQEFSLSLEHRFEKKVVKIDERLTTFASKHHQYELYTLANQKHNRPSKITNKGVDSIAAELILQTYFASIEGNE